MMKKHPGSKGILTVISSFLFFSVIIPFLFGYALWRPVVLVHTFSVATSRMIFYVMTAICWVLFNVKVFEELIYSRTMLVLSAYMLDLCMIPTCMLPFALFFDASNVVYKFFVGVPILAATRRVYGYAAFTFAIVLNIVGFYRGTHINTKRYTIRTHKIKDNRVRFAHVSDIHIGSRLDKLPEVMVKRILEEKPDFVVITGDLIDSHNVVPSDLAPFIAFKERNIPVYYTIGNHDIMAGEAYVSKILEYYGITFIKNDVVHTKVGNAMVQLVGIDDMQTVYDYNKVFNELETQIDPSEYTILLHHRPQGYKSSVKSGRVDLQLAGHTHNGQIFPYSYIVSLFHSKACGMYTIKDGNNDMLLYTHPGSCAWGPHFRTSSKNLVTMFTVEPY